MHQLDLFPELQSAYRLYHSTETALLIVTFSILMAMDKHELTLLVVLGLSASFDTFDHSILEAVLEQDYGFNGDALTWKTSYLDNGTQSFQLQNIATSEPKPLKYGVLQGSCYGTVAFELYASKLFAVMRKQLCRVHVNADDINLSIIYP